MHRRFPDHDPRLAPYERAHWVDGSYSSDRFEHERGFVHKTGQDLDRWAPARQDYTGVGPRGWRRQDERVLEEVCHALERHGEVDASEIEVQCREGEVTLSGQVADRHQKRLAEQIVERVQGVTDVHNRLRVQTNERLAHRPTETPTEISTESTVTGATRDTPHGGMPGVY